MVEESPLIEIYKDIHIQFEEMFCLDHKTSQHSPANMMLMLRKVMKYMDHHNVNKFISKWGSEYEITDLNSIGIAKLMIAVNKAWVKQKNEAKQLDTLKSSTLGQVMFDLRILEEQAVDDNVDLLLHDDGSLFV
jgi:hypothetical protein